MSLRTFLHEWSELLRFKSLSAQERSIVFYSEDASSWKHLGPIIEELIDSYGRSVSYVTSSAIDPILSTENIHIRPFLIGLGTARTTFFKSLQADVMVMTMPDLDTFHIKRSKHPVHYVYVNHSLVSTHMVYRLGAFDHFDSILCVGPHHIEEIRTTETLYNLKSKHLVEAGYPLLDSVLESRSECQLSYHRVQKRILIAPSWGEGALLESCGPTIIQILLDAGFEIVVRPHVMTMNHNPQILDDINQKFGKMSRFMLDQSMTSQGTVHNFDLMITDWSGSGLEYAFGLERPVLFVDVEKKINNPAYQKISITPIEVAIRTQIGDIVSPDHLTEIPDKIQSLLENSDVWRDKIKGMRSKWVYNIGNSAVIGATHINEVYKTISG